MRIPLREVLRELASGRQVMVFEPIDVVGPAAQVRAGAEEGDDLRGHDPRADEVQVCLERARLSCLRLRGSGAHGSPALVAAVGSDRGGLECKRTFGWLNRMG